MTTQTAGGAAPGRVIAAALVALLVGLLLGRAFVPAAGEEVAAAPSELREVLAEADTLRRVGGLSAYLAKAEPEQLPEIQAAIESLGIDGTDVEPVLFVEWWGSFDPAAALDWASAPERTAFIGLRPAALRVWARADGPEALTRARDGGDRNRVALAREAALIGWDESLDPGLVDYVLGLREESLREQALPIIARRRVVTLGFDGAIQWLRTLPGISPALAGQLRGELVVSGASIDPEAVARWVTPLISGDKPTGLPLRVGTRWARIDPAAAMEWLGTLPEGPDRLNGLEETYRDWLYLDAEGAMAWMEGHLGKSWLEPATTLYARRLSERDPERALEVVGAFERTDERNTTQIMILRGWLQRDREAAEAWMESADLPPSVRERATRGRG